MPYGNSNIYDIGDLAKHLPDILGNTQGDYSLRISSIGAFKKRSADFGYRIINVILTPIHESGPEINLAVRINALVDDTPQETHGDLASAISDIAAMLNVKEKTL